MTRHRKSIDEPGRAHELTPLFSSCQSQPAASNSTRRGNASFRSEIPDIEIAIPVAVDDRLALVEKCDASLPNFQWLGGRYDFASLDVPDFECRFLTSANQTTAIGTESDTVDWKLVASNDVIFATFCAIPDPDSIIITDGGQQFSVRAE